MLTFALVIAFDKTNTDAVFSIAFDLANALKRNKNNFISSFTSDMLSIYYYCSSGGLGALSITDSIVKIAQLLAEVSGNTQFYLSGHVN
jgi:hypothetical protein